MCLHFKDIKDWLTHKMNYLKKQQHSNTWASCFFRIRLYTIGVYIATTIYVSFFKQAGEWHWMLLFLNGSFYELANPLCLWISGAEIVWFMGIFSVYWSETVVCTFVCTADSRVQVYMRYTCIWTRMLSFKKCPKLCSMKFWSCLGSILQYKQNCLQEYDAYSKFNTWPLPK